MNSDSKTYGHNLSKDLGEHHEINEDLDHIKHEGSNVSYLKFTLFN
jgi:hypothetical protein